MSVTTWLPNGFHRDFPASLFLELQRDYRAPMSLESVEWSPDASWEGLEEASVVLNRGRGLVSLACEEPRWYGADSVKVAAKAAAGNVWRSFMLSLARRSFWFAK